MNTDNNTMWHRFSTGGNIVTVHGEWNMAAVWCCWTNPALGPAFMPRLAHRLQVSQLIG